MGRLVVVVLLFLCGGCCTFGNKSGVKTLEPSVHAEISRRSVERKTVVVLADGSRVGARDVKFIGTEVSWLDPTTGQRGSAEARRVHEIRIVNRGRGACKGGLYGGLGGLALGVLIGLLHKDSEDCAGTGGHCDPESVRTEETVMAGVVLGMTGYLVGLPVGAAVGVDDVYRAPLPTPGP